MAPLPVVTFVLGGWNLGISGELILQGVVFAQFAHYMSLYKTDTLFLRAFVAGLLVLTTLKSVQGLVILWIQNVQHFTDVEAAVDMFFSTWTSELNLTLVAVIAFYVQLFFCQRLWAISRNIYLVGLVMVLFVFALLASMVSSAFTFSRDPRNKIWIAIHLGTVFAGDLILCGTTAYFLSYRSKQALPQTAGMLNAIIKLTFQSAAPAALCAFINLVASQAGNIGATANAWSMIAIIANNLLPKLYAISAMWTLNSRKDIRLVRSNGNTNSSTEGPSGRRRMNNVELGMLSSSGHRGPIQVRTQVQTTQHTDDIDMFPPKMPLDDIDEGDSPRGDLKN
ncbi:hypothetical protein DFH09DRAFT_1492764 [Mycena vulgaris]|nr:hypothetical protein DFH09DRAFT_1492764 [Mycena vulgaris]